MAKLVSLEVQIAILPILLGLILYISSLFLPSNLNYKHLTLDFKSWDILESAVVEEVMKFKGYWSFLKVLRKGLEPKISHLKQYQIPYKMDNSWICQDKTQSTESTQMTFERRTQKELSSLDTKTNYSSAIELIASISKPFFGSTFIPTPAYSFFQ